MDIANKNCAEAFAGFFHDKINKFKSDIFINENVHNCYNKLIVVDRFFMEESDVCNYLKSIKSKMFE
jgi:hypothetical protein